MTQVAGPERESLEKKRAEWAAQMEPDRKARKAGIVLIVAPFGCLFLLFILLISTVFLAGPGVRSSFIPTAQAVEAILPEDLPTNTFASPTEEAWSYPIIAEASSSIVLGSSDMTDLTNVILAAGLGLAAVFVMMLMGLAFTVAIPLLFRRKLKEGVAYDIRSGKGAQSEIPDEIRGWHWGAAGLSTIWGSYHGVWMFLIGLIPFVSLVWWIVMGLKGSEWAWRKRRWISVEQFQDSKRRWMPWGLAFMALTVLSLLGWVQNIVGLMAIL